MKHQNETAMQYMRRIVSNCDFEVESILDDLPTIEAVVGYFELWSQYGTEFLSGIKESIEEGASPVPLRDFIAKYSLPWDAEWIHSKT